MKKCIRFLAAFLALLIVLPVLCGTVFAQDDDVYEIVEKQVRAYADSIDKSNADEEAAWALAGHGVSKKGQKLIVDESHYLTATIMNCELTQKALSFGCTELIRIAQEVHDPEIYSAASLKWYASGNSYALYAGDGPDAWTDRLYMVLGYSEGKYNKTNAYDKSMEWIGGTVGYFIHMERKNVTQESVTYDVEVRFTDRFDFDPDNAGSISKALLSLLGSFMFKSFDWEATVSFDITVPFSCDHSSGSFRWVREGDVLVNDTADDFCQNPLTQIPVPDEENSVYYRLDRTAHLYHDRPWVLEYTVKKPGAFALSPLENTKTPYPCIYNRSRSQIFFHDYEYVKLTKSEMEKYGVSSERQNLTHFYGSPLSSLFTYTAKSTVTIRLENRINSDGTNMVYLTVYSHDKEKYVLENVPMDDYYLTESWGETRAFQEDGNNWVSGKDVLINYIGNTQHYALSGLLDLTIWENGKDGVDADYLADKRTAPTCTEGGYTEYTCSLCGATFQDNETPAKGHSFGEWAITRTPTLQETGEQTRSCQECGHTERVELPKLEPNRGDSTCDGEIDGRDLILLRQQLAGWAVSIDAHGADVNGDGSINGKDLILLRQCLAGWDVTLGS